LKETSQNMKVLEKVSNHYTCEICGSSYTTEDLGLDYDTLQRHYDKGKRTIYIYDVGICGYLCNKKECLDTVSTKKRKEKCLDVMAKAGIPKKFINIISDKDYDKYVDDKKGVYLWGETGTGKTVMASSIIREYIIKYGGKIKYISSPKMIMELQDSYKNDKESPVDILKKLSRVDILFIDDLGAEKLTEFVRQSIYFLINEREQWERPTIITSNYSLSEIDVYIDKRISSRIAGMCSIVKVGGDDLRLKPKKEHKLFDEKWVSPDLDKDGILDRSMRSGYVRVG